MTYCETVKVMPREQKEDNEQKWRRYEDKIRAKRGINTNRKRKSHSDQVPKLRRDELIVQRLSSTVSEKAQKFSRIGPREFVPYTLMMISQFVGLKIFPTLAKEFPLWQKSNWNGV